MNEEPLEHFKELCAVWIDHLNQTISFHPARDKVYLSL